MAKKCEYTRHKWRIGKAWNYINPLLYKHIPNIHNTEHLLDRNKGL